MFEIGFWELALIFGLALVVLGPDRLPGLARQLGRYVGQARRMARTLTTQLRTELEAEEQRIMGRQTPPPAPAPPSYSRPGVDDLKPGRTADDIDTASGATAPGTPESAGSAGHPPAP